MPRLDLKKVWRKLWILPPVLTILVSGTYHVLPPGATITIVALTLIAAAVCFTLAMCPVLVLIRLVFNLYPDFLALARAIFPHLTEVIKRWLENLFR
jgi:hypothetical protein